jgi:hypothetical protein
MRLLLVFSVVIAGVLSNSNSKDYRPMYKQIQEKYGMPVLTSNRQEGRKLFQEFCKYAQFVEEHNKDDASGYKAEVNMFALMVSVCTSLLRSGNSCLMLSRVQNGERTNGGV